MWSFANYKNRILADELFKLFINHDHQKNEYNKYKNKKGYDQFFLSHHVYHRLKPSAMIHDSYLCNFYRDSIPFPSRRKGNCFVSTGYSFEICSKENVTNHFVCPVNCRPKDHKDWETC